MKEKATTCQDADNISYFLHLTYAFHLVNDKFLLWNSEDFTVEPILSDNLGG